MTAKEALQFLETEGNAVGTFPTDRIVVRAGGGLYLVRRPTDKNQELYDQWERVGTEVLQGGDWGSVDLKFSGLSPETVMARWKRGARVRQEMDARALINEEALPQEVKSGPVREARVAMDEGEPLKAASIVETCPAEFSERFMEKARAIVRGGSR